MALIYVTEVMEIILQVAAVKASVDTTVDHPSNQLRDGPTEADGRVTRPCSLFGPLAGRRGVRCRFRLTTGRLAGRDGTGSADVPGMRAVRSNL
jgi:hypothetical protein